jgi:prolyl oligopeptidase
MLPTTLLCLALACASVGSDGAAPVQAPPPPAAAAVELPRYDARTFYETTSLRGASFSHDESKVLLSTDASGVFNVYAQPLAGDEPIQLTHSSTDAHMAVSYFPADDRFLTRADKGGNELTHLYVAERDGALKDLTPGAKVKASFVRWSADGRWFFVTTNERDPRSFDLYRYATDGYERELLFQNKDAYEIAAVSPDGKWVALDKSTNNLNSNVYVARLGRKRARPVLVTPHDGQAQHQAAVFSPDSKRLIYRTDAHGEFMQAWSYELAGRRHAQEAAADWDVSGVRYSHGGKYRAVTTNADAHTVVTVTEFATGKTVALPDLGDAQVTRVTFSRSERRAAVYVSGDRSPPDLVVVDLQTGEHRRHTRSLNPAIDPEQLVDGRNVRFPSFDGLEIPALLYRPRDASADNQVPAILRIHGGPGGQSRLGYNPSIQHLVNHGYAVLAVNNRGSSGYGKTFYHLDDRRHGDVDLKDCVWARKYLDELDWIDGKRVGILGGSYGGYMVLAALAFEPDAFEVGVDIFGVANWIRTLESIPPWWTSFRDSLYAEIGDPKVDRERLEEFSPLLHYQHITRPLLVIQGANDPRVLKVESDEIVAGVRQNGVPVEYVVFDDEGHGFRKRQNRITAAETVLRFLDEYL